MTGWQQISDTDHHGGAYLTSTALKAALKSPAHYRLHMQGKTPDNAAFAFGRAAHSRVLEPWDYPKRYAVAPKVDRRTKDGKSKWAAFVEASAGKEVLKHEDGNTIEAMAKSISNNPDSSRWINPDSDDNFTEQSGIVMDERYGLLACRPDLRVVGDYIVDLKTCARGGASPSNWEKSVVNFSYDLSAAWYVDLARRIDSHDYRFIWVVVEKEAPHAVACYEASYEQLEEGRELYGIALEVISACSARATYPASYFRGTMSMQNPTWSYARVDAARKMMQGLS